jgi:D-alanyl-lipoteichoic acid acyltransferase DltB (MBOAT superfamily)
MSLSSISFLALYFPMLLIVYYNPIFKSQKFKNVILLLASLGLYAMAEPIYIFGLMGSIILNYIFVTIRYKTNQKLWGYIAIIFDIAVLLLFKYINQILGLIHSNNEITYIAIPIGISYFTFREISYVVECIKDDKYKSTGLLETSLFICNFMSISAGPLGFYDDEIEQFCNREINKNLIYTGIYRCVIGLVKKIIIADSLKKLVDVCFAQSNLSMIMAWAGAVAYTLEIYFDFSGYSDMAIGIGNVFGFKLMENFSLPYTAKSISEFWKKWHISLTKWFTRYIYIPLGGSRVNTKYRHIFNLWVVWLCTGIWHGSNWTFIVWGMIYFILQVLEKYTNISEKINRIHFGHIYTMLVVTLCWVIFRSDNLVVAFNYIGAMFGLKCSGIIGAEDFGTIKYYLFTIVIGILGASSLVDKFDKIKENHIWVSVAQYVITFAVFIITLVIMIWRGYTAPLYAGF